MCAGGLAGRLVVDQVPTRDHLERRIVEERLQPVLRSSGVTSSRSATTSSTARGCRGVLAHVVAHGRPERLEHGVAVAERGEVPVVLVVDQPPESGYRVLAIVTLITRTIARLRSSANPAGRAGPPPRGSSTASRVMTPRGPSSAGRPIGLTSTSRSGARPRRDRRDDDRAERVAEQSSAGGPAPRIPPAATNSASHAAYASMSCGPRRRRSPTRRSRAGRARRCGSRAAAPRPARGRGGRRGSRAR